MAQVTVGGSFLAAVHFCVCFSLLREHSIDGTGWAPTRTLKVRVSTFGAQVLLCSPFLAPHMGGLAHLLPTLPTAHCLGCLVKHWLQSVLVGPGSLAKARCHSGARERGAQGRSQSHTIRRRGSPMAIAHSAAVRPRESCSLPCVGHSCGQKDCQMVGFYHQIDTLEEQCREGILSQSSIRECCGLHAVVIQFLPGCGLLSSLSHALDVFCLSGLSVCQIVPPPGRCAPLPDFTWQTPAPPAGARSDGCHFHRGASPPGLVLWVLA